MKDRVVIVTGGTSGIGRAAALAFADAGSDVLVTGRNEESLRAVSKLRDSMAVLRADSAEPESAAVIVETAMQRWNRIDVVVNNAGAGAIAPLDSVTVDQMDSLHSLNVAAPSLLAAAALPHLKASAGNIINISSTIGHRPTPGLSHYGASKAALEYLTRAWALELAPDVRVNAVAPGPTESGALTGMMGLTEEQAAAVRAQEAEQIPLKRRGVPEDISQAIVWLASPAAAWVTGQVIGIDGGFGVGPS